MTIKEVTTSEKLADARRLSEVISPVKCLDPSLAKKACALLALSTLICWHLFVQWPPGKAASSIKAVKGKKCREGAKPRFLKMM